MASLLNPTAIANRALQRVGAALLAAGTLSTATSREATQVNTCYDMLRQSELRRNVWTFSTRRTVLRPYNTPSNIVNSGTPNQAGVTQMITFGTWATGTTYAQSDIAVGSDGHLYVSLQASNLGKDPTLDTSYAWWTLYFGPDVAQEFVTTYVSTITYAIGNNVIGSDGNPYQSIANSNTGNNPVTDGGVHWATGTAVATKVALPTGFYSGELMYVGNKLYLSLVNNNTVDPTTNVDFVSGKTYTNAWMQMTTAATLSALNFVYPIGAGSLSDTLTRNVYRLPVGFLREAPQMPKQGSYTELGAPTNLPYNDWEYDGHYILSSGTGPLVLRFAADVRDTTLFDPMFAEGFACRIALEIAESLTQSEAKLQIIGQMYAKFMGDAREVNAIEQGPIEQPLDDFLQVRY